MFFSTFAIVVACCTSTHLNNNAEEVAMDDLERRTQQFLRDWQALRQSLERIPQDQPGDPFLHTQLELIATSIDTLHDIVHSITRCPALSADGAPPPHDQPSPGGRHAGGLGAHLRRIRQAEEAWDDLPWRGSGASAG
jgi:hypothetical protein